MFTLLSTKLISCNGKLLASQEQPGQVIAAISKKILNNIILCSVANTQPHTHKHALSTSSLNAFTHSCTVATSRYIGDILWWLFVLCRLSDRYQRIFSNNNNNNFLSGFALVRCGRVCQWVVWIVDTIHYQPMCVYVWVPLRCFYIIKLLKNGCAT